MKASAVFKTLVCCLCFKVCQLAAPEQGIYKRTLTKTDNSLYIVKTLYRDSIVKVAIVGKDKKCASTEAIEVFWQVRSSSCFGAFSAPSSEWQSTFINHITYTPQYQSENVRGEYVLNYVINGNQHTTDDKIYCDKNNILHCHNDWKNITVEPTTKPPTTEAKPDEKKNTQKREVGDPPAVNEPSESSDTEDDVASENAVTAAPDVENTATSNSETPAKESQNGEANPGEQNAEETDAGSDKSVDATDKSKCPAPKDAKHVVAVVPERSYYLFYLFTTNIHSDDAYEVTIELKSPVGYLSAHEYPLLTFYMCMCIAYIIYALLWLVMCACNYRDLLRVQFWIGGVILLGMIEKAVFYSEFLSVDQTGISVIGAAKFAEIVSALKRTLARMLVIIVSLGFGIVKPRLGPMLHRIIVVGGLYFVLAVVEAMIRNDSSLHDPNNRAVILAFIPLAILDAVICWWVFMSLLQTMKTLRLRRNTTKLSLYRHFSNAIIFCVLASIIMIIWSWRVHSVRCMVDWPQLWMETAFWHLLFSVILFVIMILWRPTANNQRYAYSPMVDGNDSDEDEEPMLSGGARETVKMRGGKKFERSGGDKTEEDLKWIEENIPQTIADVALPMLESDDEDEITTKYEMSKME
uniref:transmembrane protein 87A n=1 Tax=Ciona intestinalis TaxID=7719 RepID=UPI000180B7A9|nr:transmembrane protein 87A [Ciona intestinalis]|eukprot:XP_002130124.1 transmembrane protein 87A [Ciona intestinalis]